MGRISTLDLFASIASAQRMVVTRRSWLFSTDRGNNVKHCLSVPPDVHDYFRHELNRTTDMKKSKEKKKLLREEVAAEGNVVHDIDSDDDEL
jgi:hypothetical protein